MFVIPCRYNPEHKFIYDLVKDIREYHPIEKIVIVDSDSADKSYFELSSMYDNVEVLDVANKNYHVGAYWIAYNTYPDEEFYYFLHDSMRVKTNLDYLKDKDFTAFAHFVFCGGGDVAKSEIEKYTPYKVPASGHAIAGPCFFVKNFIMKTFKGKGVDKILPTFSQHSDVKIGVAAYAVEGSYGIFFQNEGYNIVQNSLIGDITQRGVNHTTPNYDSSWMYPIEKLLAKRK